MMWLVGKILIIFIYINFGISHVLHCEYSTFNVLNIKDMANIYSCEGTLITKNESNRTVIDGKHSDTNENDGTVKGLRIAKNKLTDFLSYIEESFPNLEQINLSSNEITTLTNEDLTPHQNLAHFMIDRNQITSLDSNIFKNLPNLKAFYLNYNKLKHVQHNIVLPTDVSFYFEDNTCISRTAKSDEEIKQLELDFIVKCPPTIPQIEKELESRQNLLTYLEAKSIVFKNIVEFLELKNKKISEALDEA